MPASVADIVRACNSEWEHWGRSSWNLITGRKEMGHTDDEEEFAQRVIDRYCAVAGGNPTLDEIADDRYAWSAVCVSTILADAGYLKREFPFAQSHSTFIRHFVRARKDGDAGAAYWGFRITEPEAVPEPGDIVGCGRGTGVTFERAQRLFDKTERYDSHTDIVVAKRPGEIDVIGGNVRDSVTRKTLPLDSRGLVADRSNPWFVVLKRR